MVASNSWGLSRSFDAAIELLFLLSPIFISSLGLSEKNDTSDPDINADRNSKIRVITNVIAVEKVIVT